MYVLGIDGGGTKTAAVILDGGGRVLGAGESGPSTYGVVPPDVTRASIAGAAEEARRAAGLPDVPFAAAFLGLGNVVSDLDREAVREIAAGLGLAQRAAIGVDHDCRIALAGGLAGRPGIVLIAGTGTSCYGRSAAGAGWRAGGWGPLIDDEGSSYWLGIQAMRAAARSFDGRDPHTMLAELVAAELRLDEMNELMNRLYAAAMTRTEIAALAPLVYQAAAAGDRTANELLRIGSEAMADCVLAVARALAATDKLAVPGELAVVGGLTNAGAALFQPLTQAVQARLPNFRVLPAELPPAVGAALLALEQAGAAAGPAALEALRAASLAL